MCSPQLPLQSLFHPFHIQATKDLLCPGARPPTYVAPDPLVWRSLLDLWTMAQATVPLAFVVHGAWQSIPTCARRTNQAYARLTAGQGGHGGHNPLVKTPCPYCLDLAAQDKDR